MAYPKDLCSVCRNIYDKCYLWRPGVYWETEYFPLRTRSDMEQQNCPMCQLIRNLFPRDEESNRSHLHTAPVRMGFRSLDIPGIDSSDLDRVSLEQGMLLGPRIDGNIKEDGMIRGTFCIQSLCGIVDEPESFVQKAAPLNNLQVTEWLNSTVDGQDRTQNPQFQPTFIDVVDKKLVTQSVNHFVALSYVV
jgi:hypothetical protein